MMLEWIGIAFLGMALGAAVLLSAIYSLTCTRTAYLARAFIPGE